MTIRFSATRRHFLKASAVASASAVALNVVLPARRSLAAELPQVSEDDSTAKQLKYTHDASTSSARPSGDQVCGNCLYYKGTSDDEWAKCDLFPGKVVSGSGWCSAWSKKG